MSGEQFSLVWNSFPSNLSSGLYTLLTDEQLVDVTLAAEGQILRAHKLILSVCSTYFKELFRLNSCKHPIVILKDVNYRDLSAMLHFMYQGEVNIKQEDLASFLKVAETLQIKGLTKDKNEKDVPSTTEEESSKLEKNAPPESRELDSLLETDAKLEPTSAVKDGESSVAMNENSSSVNDDCEATKDSRITLAGVNSNYTDPSDQQNTTAIEPESIIREILSNRSVDFAEEIQPTIDEPLDYTSDIGRLERTKNEPPDYSSDTDLDAVCNGNYSRQDHTDRNINLQDNAMENDCGRNSELLTYNPSNQNEPLPLSHLEATFGTDFRYDNGNYSKGRRTVKGIPGSSLPLETTLRVVSELGPTLRVERGKVIRMYSCPWCLRHFTRKENLKLHVRYIHGPLESLTCKLCGNKYKNSNSLRVHSYLYHNAKRNKHSKSPLVDSSM